MTLTWALLILGWIVACGLICLLFNGAGRAEREQRDLDPSLPLSHVKKVQR